MQAPASVLNLAASALCIVAIVLVTRRHARHEASLERYALVIALATLALFVLTMPPR